MSCSKNCEYCTARPLFVCHGDFYTSGEYASIIDDFDMEYENGDRIASVKHLLDIDTVTLLKVLICDSNSFDYPTEMELIRVLDEIINGINGEDDKDVY